MLGFISAVATVAAGISSAVVSSVPVVGTAIAAVSNGIGGAVGAAVTKAGTSSVIGNIASGATTTAINGAAYNAYSSHTD